METVFIMAKSYLLFYGFFISPICHFSEIGCDEQSHAKIKKCAKKYFPPNFFVETYFIMAKSYLLFYGFFISPICNFSEIGCDEQSHAKIQKSAKKIFSA